jgi:RHS repeat-associated protein
VQYLDRRGQTSTFQYDTLNRLTKEAYSDATVTRSYDANSRLINVNDSAGGVFGFGYDADGHLLTQEEPTGTVQYTRDALGRVATRQVAGQPAVQYAYDAVGNMLSAAMPAVGVAYTYDPRNLPQALTRTNGVVTNYTFDALGQVLSIIHSLGATALNTQTYTYDAVGNRSVISNDISQPLITQSASATVDNANELLTDGGTTYTSDANGNRLTETSATGALTYNWDGRNRLSSITDGSDNKITLRYDPGRSLLGISHNNGTATTAQGFVVDSLTNVVSLTSLSGAASSVLTGRTVDSYFASVDTGGNAQLGMEDALESTRFIGDSAGALESKFQYEPFGQTSGTVSSTYPFTFTGRIPVTGNIYNFRSRYYDSGAARFIAEDPVGISSGVNPYTYADNNPISNTDPLGLAPLSGQARKYFYKTIYTFLTRSKVGKQIVKDIEEDLGEAYGKSLLSCKGKAWEESFIGEIAETLVDVYATAQAAVLVGASAPTGPIGWFVSGVNYGFTLGQAFNDVYKIETQILNGPTGEPGSCGCNNQ